MPIHFECCKFSLDQLCSDNQKFSEGHKIILDSVMEIKFPDLENQISHAMPVAFHTWTIYKIFLFCGNPGKTCSNVI